MLEFFGGVLFLYLAVAVLAGRHLMLITGWPRGGLRVWARAIAICLCWIAMFLVKQSDGADGAADDDLGVGA